MIRKLNKNRTIAVSSLLAALLFSGLVGPASRASSAGQRQLSFYHTHTQRNLQVTYAIGGEYVESALAEINVFLADFRNGEQLVIDPALLDLIYDVRESLGGSGAFEVISAYRSPATNEMLRSKSSGVAKNSQHLLGSAIDVRLRGVSTVALRDAAISLQRGGVGYYQSSDFVHIDTGRVRRW
jgi:uncharacterized protein YcbK (DUF882 family)